MKKNEPTTEPVTDVAQATGGQLAKVDLEKNKMTGLVNVDPVADVQLPTLKKVEGLSKDVVLKNGSRATLGKIFNTLTLEERDSVDGVFLRVAKKQYLPMRKEDVPENYRWRWDCVFFDYETVRPYYMNFQSTSFNAMKNLISQAVNNNVPIWSLSVTVETKSIEDKDKNVWYVYTLRKEQMKPIEDQGTLEEMQHLAERFTAVPDVDHEEPPTPEDNPY